MICSVFASFIASADVSVTIPDDYKQLNAGGSVIATVRISNLESTGREDVILNYDVKDSSGKTIFSKQETDAVETQASFVKTMQIPESAGEGRYSVNANVVYASGKVSSASSSFEVAKQSNNMLLTGIISFIVMIIMILAVLGLVKGRTMADRMRVRMKVRDIVRARGLNR